MTLTHCHANYLVTGCDTGNIAVWRFLPDGSLDTSFGSSGEEVIDLGAFEYGTAIAVQSDGKIIVAGASTSTEGGLPVVRLNSDGSLDTTFGHVVGSSHTGIRLIDLGPASGMTVQSDGDLVICGSGDNGYLIRLNASDGSTDTSFGTSGVVTIPGTVFKLTMQSTSDDRLVVMSQYQSAITISRYNADGSADTSFSTYAVELGWLAGNGGLAMQADGKVIFARSVYATHPTDAGIVVGRLNSDGSLDTTFGTSGWSTLHFATGTEADIVNTLAIQSDGQIVVGGCANANDTLDWGIARLGGGVTREYSQHDANFNVTGFADNNGNVIERFVYSAYGVQTVLTGAWVASAASNSVYGFQGGRYDVATGLNHFAARDGNPSTGTWLGPDSDGYVNGLNLYVFVQNDPLAFLDPSGHDEISEVDQMLKKAIQESDARVGSTDQPNGSVPPSGPVYPPFGLVPNPLPSVQLPGPFFLPPASIEPPVSFIPTVDPNALVPNPMILPKVPSGPPSIPPGLVKFLPPGLTYPPTFPTPFGPGTITGGPGGIKITIPLPSVSNPIYLPPSHLQIQIPAGKGKFEVELDFLLGMRPSANPCDETALA